MEIPSAFNSGVQGFQNAQASADKAAAEIAASTNPTVVQQNDAVPEDRNSGSRNPENNSELPNLNQEIVNLKVAEHQAKASTEVIKSADDSLGTLLDVSA